MVETLLRINIPSLEHYSFLPYGEGVYKATLTTPEDGYDSYYSQWLQGAFNEQRLIVGAFFVNLEPYDRKSSLADCTADEKSFYFAVGTQTLYVHYEFGVTPDSSAFSIGIQGGYSLHETRYIDGIIYEARLKTVPKLTYKVDKFQAGKMRFTDQTVTLFNGDGALDDFIQNPIPGAEASIVIYDTETEDELYFITGFVNGDANTEDELSIKIIDKRRRENIKIPSTLFDDTTYPDIESKYINKVIPEGYGAHNRITAFPVNGTVGSGNIGYKYATDATVLTSVEVKEDDVWSTVTALNSAPSTGYFELSYADATNASGGLLPCIVTATLRSQTNPGDIIKDMNDRYNSISYDATNYDMTEWASESAKLADVALYMSKAQEFFKWVEALQNGPDYWFVYTIDGSGKRTLRVNDPDRAISETIDYYDIRDDKKKVERTFDEFSSSVSISYNPDVEAKSSDLVVNTDYQEAVLAKYRTPQDSEYEALVTAEADATRKAALIAEDQSESRPVATFTQHKTTLAGLNRKLYDIVNLNTSRPATTYWEDVPDEVYSDWSADDEIYSDWSADDEIYSTVGEVKEDNTAPPSRTYWGTIRGQVIELGYSPTDLTYTLTIRERPESEVS